MVAPAVQLRDRISSPASLGLLVWLAVLIIDQTSKFLIYGFLKQQGNSLEITSFFNLVSAWNTGVSFSLFANGGEIGRWILISITGLVSLGLVYALLCTHSRVTAIAFGLILGGAVGNLLDRLRFGAVYDFLDFHWSGWHWPAFNAADTGIFVGAALLLIFGGALTSDTSTSKS